MPPSHRDGRVDVNHGERPQFLLQSAVSKQGHSWGGPQTQPGVTTGAAGVVSGDGAPHVPAGLVPAAPALSPALHLPGYLGRGSQSSAGIPSITGGEIHNGVRKIPLKLF